MYWSAGKQRKLKGENMDLLLLLGNYGLAHFQNEFDTPI